LLAVGAKRAIFNNFIKLSFGIDVLLKQRIDLRERKKVSAVFESITGNESIAVCFESGVFILSRALLGQTATHWPQEIQFWGLLALGPFESNDKTLEGHTFVHSPHLVHKFGFISINSIKITPNCYFFLDYVKIVYK